MNYSNWLLSTYPQLNEKSSAETFKLVEAAHKETLVLRMLIKTVLFVLMGALAIVFVHPILDLKPFSDIISWGLIFITFCFSSYIASFCERRLIQNSLSRLVGGV